MTTTSDDAAITAIPVVTLLDPAEREARLQQYNREMWSRVLRRDAAERRRKANMLCRRGHAWRDQGPLFLCGPDPSVSYWRECARCRMTLHERAGRGPRRKRIGHQLGQSEP